jgi:hypothetical protein
MKLGREIAELTAGIDRLYRAGLAGTGVLDRQAGS